MVNLRPLQTRFVADLRTAFAQGARKVLGVAPCGFGKTRTMVDMARQSVEKGKRVLILTHREELLEQIRAAALDGGLTADRCQIASIQTIARRLKTTTPPDFIIVDESAHAVASTWAKVLNHWPKAHVCGKTATPSRLDGRGLGDIFDAMVMGPTPKTLIEQGWLVQPTYYAPPSLVSTDEIPIKMGDFDRQALSEAVDKPAIVGDAVEHFRRICPGERAIVFCVSRKHAENVAWQFFHSGFNAQAFHGGLKASERRSIMGMFRGGSIQILTTVDLIGEGLDVGSVGAVVLLRPTASLSLFIQWIGRGMRTSPGKSRCVVLDHTGNVMRHGLAEWDREWSLTAPSRRVKNGDAGRAVGICRCEVCFAVSLSRDRCSTCGVEFTAEQRRLAERAGTLTEVETKVCPRCGDPTVTGARCKGCQKIDKKEEKEKANRRERSSISQAQPVRS